MIFIILVSCSSAVSSEILRMKNKVACKARETLVDLITKEDLHVLNIKLKVVLLKFYINASFRLNQKLYL